MLDYGLDGVDRAFVAVVPSLTILDIDNGLSVAVLDLYLQAGFDSTEDIRQLELQSVKWRGTAYMSRGYTSALARTAPVAPAMALPQGGRGFAPSDM